MSGGLIQLIAVGAQDSYLTGSASITFWRSTYRRHTPHAVESVQNTFSGNADFGKKVTATISRNGDLISNMYLEVELPVLPTFTDTAGATRNVSYVNHVGLALIKSVEVEIGGQRIDRLTGEFMKIWNELSLADERKRGFDKMVGSYPEPLDADVEDLNRNGGKYYIPIQFWFSNGNPGQALPIIALQYHETRVSFEFRDIMELVRIPSDASGLIPTSWTRPNIRDASLFVDYVFLGQEERRKFASSSHEYLITQCQFLGDESIASGQVNNKVRLNFNHPVKALYWVFTRDTKATREEKSGNQWFDFGSNWSGNSRVTTATLMLNGHERFSARAGSYFSTLQPYQHHTRVPDSQIFMYSFALAPQDLQPSGSMNFSRTDNATLTVNVDTTVMNAAGKIKVYALSINVLRVLSGMAGLAYSN
jgi:hypothetical protein